MAAQSQQAAAQTDASVAAGTLDRYKQLQAEKSVSPQEMDEVEKRAEASAERLDVSRAQTEAAKAQDSGARPLRAWSRCAWPIREQWPLRACLYSRSIELGRCNLTLRWMSRRLARFTRG
jgi:hypothetical protein